MHFTAKIIMICQKGQKELEFFRSGQVHKCSIWLKYKSLHKRTNVELNFEIELIPVQRLLCKSAVLDPLGDNAAVCLAGNSDPSD